jgi:hypothetical protein
MYVSLFKQKSQSNFSPNINIKLGRVYDIVLDEGHPDYSLHKTIGVIRYNTFDSDTFKEDVSNLFMAYPYDSTNLTLPLKGEVVELIGGPRDDEERSDSEYKTYYGRVVSGWNAVNHNSLPIGDTDEVIDTDLGKNIEELRVNQLYPNPGDSLIDGRTGNSIRLGGYSGKKSSITDDTNNGKPYIIIDNGRDSKEDSLLPISEDINKDKSSIYLVSDHLVPLKQSNTKLSSNVVKTIHTDKYKGNQIILNSGRLVFNTKEEDIFFSAKESFTVTGRDVNIDGEDYISLDAKKIYLGENSMTADTNQGTPEPVVLGHQLDDFLSQLLDELNRLGNSFDKLVAPGNVVPIMKSASMSLKSRVKSLKGFLKDSGPSRIKSDKVFVHSNKIVTNKDSNKF